MSNFNYDELVQKALISVVRDVLKDVSKNGLSGNHHFYIRFRTDHPKVKIPAYLKERHPEEIMIVIQYQFWNLEVFDYGFSVELSFNQVPELISVPFSALTAFVDPSVKFALQFTPSFSDDDFVPPKKEHPAGDDNIIKFDNFRKKR